MSRANRNPNNAKFTAGGIEQGRVQEVPMPFTVSDDVESNHGSLKIGYCKLGD